MKQKGFTLIEILLVVAAIAILAGIVILAINPAKQLGQTRDAERNAEIKTILEAVYQYSIDRRGFPITIPNEATEICKNAGGDTPVAFDGSLLMASVTTANGKSTLTVRTTCLPDETLASSGDVQPVIKSICTETGTWNIMELAGNKKLSGSGYGCRIENQRRGEGFGHRVCMADIQEVVEEEVVEEAPDSEDQEGSNSPNCVDLSFLTENEVYLTAIPEDPTNESETGTGYYIQQSANGRITVSAPNAEQDEALSMTR